MSDPVKRWRPLLARVSLFVSLLVGVTYAYGVYTDFRFHDQLTMDTGVWAVIFISGLVCGAAVRLLIRLSPNLVLGALFGGTAAFPLAIVAVELFGEAGAPAGFGLMLLGAAIGAVLAFKYKLW